MNSNAILKRISQMLLVVSPMATLAISPFANYDPINLIKLLIITSIAFAVLGLIVSDYSNLKKRLKKNLVITSVLFLCALLSPILFSGAPKTQQFWGMFGRNTGFLTYLSLFFILIGATIIQSTNFYKNVVWSLVITSVLVSIYALFQIVHMDPVGWSTFDIFATLGNANFLSAFLGMSALASLVLIFEKKLNKARKTGLLVLALVQIFIILYSKSIQGFMILLVGLIILSYFVLADIIKIKYFQLPFFLMMTLGTVLTILGISNKGPLSKLLYQETILFRMDYWHAGWKMIQSHPLTGVGIDSYGDWYRTVRGSISALRTTPDRTANTAHNIFLDVASSGGFPLLITYLALLALAFWSSLKVFKRRNSFDPVFIALFSCWCAYQIQACVSINQVGVGVWGWLLTGSLIGYEKCDLQIVATKVSNRKKDRLVVLPPMAGLVAFLFTSVGFILAFIPFQADVKFKTAIQTKDLVKMMSSVNQVGTTAWHITLVLESAATSGFTPQAIELDDELLKKFPRDFYAWKMRYILQADPMIKAAALQKLREIDPDNPVYFTQ